MRRLNATLSGCVLAAGILCSGPALAQPSAVEVEASGSPVTTTGVAPAERGSSERAIDEDRVVRHKARRLRIAGWSFLAGATVAFGSIFVLQATSGDSDDASGDFLMEAIVLGAAVTPALLTIGGALLLRARLFLRRRRNSERSALSVELTGTGARLRLEF